MTEILDVLKEQYLWDIAQFSKPWMYWCVFPVVFFMIFFVAKWALLTAPLWIPVSMIVKGICIPLTIETKVKKP